MIRFTFLSENKTETPECPAEHGLSIYIETEHEKILFDAGASAQVYAENAEKCGVSLGEVDYAVVSHGHYDHTGGFPDFCERNGSSKIFIHRDAFREAYGKTKEGQQEKMRCSIRWPEEVRERILPRMVFTEEPHWISRDIAVSGTIPEVAGFVPAEVFSVKLSDGSFRDDDMSHEQFLGIRSRDETGKSQGLYLFSGCSHKGVQGVIAYAKMLFPGERIACLVAGMHLYESPPDKTAALIACLQAEGIGCVMPVHCTGIEAICALKAAMGEKCIPAAAGNTYRF